MSPTSPSSPAEPLDSARWDRLKSLQQATGRDFLGEIIDLYLKDTPDRLSRLRQALADGDIHQAERLAHSIKGSSSNIGAPLVEAAAAQLERLLAGGSSDGAEDVLARLESETARVYLALEALRPAS